MSFIQMKTIIIVFYTLFGIVQVVNAQINGKIAFRSNRDGNNEIYIMNADGSNPKNITNHLDDDYDPSWSPDGSKIAFSSTRHGNFEIYIMDADGSNLSRITNNSAADYEPSWSPDGSKIAFTTDRDGNYEIYIMNTDGSNQMNITKHSAKDRDPSWSPDGSQIVFESYREDLEGIYIMNMDGSSQRNITNHPDGDYDPSWSPDGSQIAFVSQRDGNGEIYIMNVDGSNQRNISNHPDGDWDPTWSPDGSKIAFESTRDGNFDIYIMDADGSNPRNITNRNDIVDYSPSWSIAPSTGILTLTSPNGGENLTAGTTQNITWTSSGVTNVKIEYSTDSGSNWITIIASTPASTGFYSWTVPNILSTNCLVRITDTANPSVTDISNAPFAIIQPSIINVLSPNGGENWTAGTKQNITWTSTNIANIRIEFSVDSGLSWYTIADNVDATTDSCSWTVPKINSTECLVKISDINGSDLKDINDNVFAIEYSITGSFEIILDETNASKWFGGDDRPGNKPRNVGAGQSIILEKDSTINSVGFKFAELFDFYQNPGGVGHEVTLVLNIRTDDGTIIDTIEKTLSSDFNGGWVIFHCDRDLMGNQEYIFTCSVKNGEVFEYQTSILAHDQDMLPNSNGYTGEINIAGGNLDDWSNWELHPWDFNFRLTGKYIGGDEPTLQLTSPNGGENWEAGSLQNITWEQSDMDRVMLMFSSDNGSNWDIIAENIDANTGSFPWTVPEIESIECLVKITDDFDTDVADVSDGVFSIIPGASESYIQVISPNGGETLIADTHYEITWTSSGIQNIKLEFSSDNGSTWEMIEEDISAVPGAYNWYVPDIESSECLIRISDYENDSINDRSDDGFNIHYVYIYVNIPYGDEEWVVNESVVIEWESKGVETVKIEYSTDNGASWNEITESIDATISQFTWTVPPEPSTDCLIRITDVSNPEIIVAISDYTFTIVRSAPEVFRFPTGNSIDSSPAVGSDGTIYIGSYDQYLYAVNSDGSQKWRFLANGEISSSPAVDSNGNIYFGCHNSFIYALNSDGTPKWSYETDDWISSSPAIGSDGTIYIGSHDYYVYAFSSNGILKWKYPTKNEIKSSPAIGSDGTIYIGSLDSLLYAIKPDGSLKWTYPTNGEIRSSPAIDNDEIIYIGSLDGCLYAIKPDGTLKWKYQTDYEIYSSPAISIDGTIYIGSNDGYFYTINPNGTLRWKYQMYEYTDSSPTLGSDGTIYIGVGDSHLYVINPNGTIKWKFPAGDNIISSPAIDSKGIIYFGSNDGVLYAIDSETNAELSDTPWPKFRHDLRNTGSVPQGARIEVLSPNGDEEWESGSSHNITWFSSGVDSVTIHYSITNGFTWANIVTGIPATTNSYTWNVPFVSSSECLLKISDASDYKIEDISDNTFTILLAFEITLLSPDGGEAWQAGSVQNITWESSGIDRIRIVFSSDNGSNWITVAENVDANTGSFSWTVPEIESFQCIVKITDDFDTDVGDTSDSTFTISSDYITVISPVTGDIWTVNSSKEIRWEFNGIENIMIELSIDDGATWNELAGNVSALTGSYSFTVPDTPSDLCRVRIRDISNPEITDTSERFEINRPELSIYHNPISEAEELQALDFTASVTTSSEIDSVIFYYRKAGEIVFDNNEAMNLINVDTSEYAFTLETGYFTAPGLEYYIVARDINGIEVRSPVDVGFYSISIRVLDIMSTQLTEGGALQNAYRMISIPLNLSHTTIDEQLMGILPQGGIGTDWRLFRFSPGSPTPDEYPNIEGFSPGVAFWLITKNDFRLKASEGTTVTTSELFNITLKQGWNDIASPWMFDISWDTIENPSRANLSPLYTYEGSWSDPVNPPVVMEPWKGYAVYSYSNMNVVIKLKPEPADKAEKLSVNNEDILWMLTIEASAGEAKDTANHFGVREDASAEWDQYDHVEPPPVGEYVSVAFQHYEWEEHPYDYTVDFRPPENTISWDFTVKTNIPQKTVVVQLSGTENLPEEYSVEIFDLDMENILDNEYNSFSFVSGKGLSERHFRIIVSSLQESEPEEQTLKPKLFLTANCYPNPFNSQTSIQYELSKPGKVTISIFNVVGQQVQVHDTGYKEQGTYEFMFDASSLTTGIYFYRVDAGYASMTGKMLYMK